MRPISIYYIIINIITYIAFGIDKLKARQHQWRLSERLLLSLCLVGGAFGGFAAMFSFTHKIHKNKFRYGVPIMMVIQIYLLYYILTKD